MDERARLDVLDVCEASVLERDTLRGRGEEVAFDAVTQGAETVRVASHDQVTIAALENTLGGDAPEIVEDYPNHHLGPCCLILAWTPSNVPLHAVVGYRGDIPDVVTVYSPPDSNEWESDFRTRRM